MNERRHLWTNKVTITHALPGLHMWQDAPFLRSAMEQRDAPGRCMHSQSTIYTTKSVVCCILLLKGINRLLTGDTVLLTQLLRNGLGKVLLSGTGKLFTSQQPATHGPAAFRNTLPLSHQPGNQEQQSWKSSSQLGVAPTAGPGVLPGREV